jgi:lipoprotein-anchoring transpeptidase ErfK/SrfK
MWNRLPCLKSRLEMNSVVPPTVFDESIQVSIARQLLIWHGATETVSYSVSTAKNGPGQQQGSGCTPTGWHVIRAKIGQDQPNNSVFVGRRPTGEIYSPSLALRFPERDWILTRILWLGGTEPGVNRYGSVDTAWRYIYIHGCPDCCPMGVPESHGCIRMRNQDILDLFERVRPGTLVLITAD